MTTQALTTADAVIVGVPMMDALEAREIVTRIKTRIDLARGELLELKDREGWKALGYRNWRACAEAEFGSSTATLYRQMEAAEIARDLGDSQFENLPTSHLQAIKDLAPDQARQAIEQARAKTNGQPTARDVWAEADQVAQRTPPDLAAAGVQLTKHGSWFRATGFSGVMNGWASDKAEPWDLAVHAAREEIARRTAAPEPAAPDLADILTRLDAHGYARTATRQKGSTTYHSFRDYSGRSEETGGEIELAEGELSFWLLDLDGRAQRAQERQEAFLDAQPRFQALGWRLDRNGAQFSLYDPEGKHYATSTMDNHLRTLATFEAGAAKRAAAAATPTRLTCPTCGEVILNGIWGDLKECGECYHARQRAAAAVPTLAELDASMPKTFEAAGYYWKSAQPIVIAHNDGWTGEAPSIALAITLAADREKAKATAPELADWWNALRAIERAMQHKKLSDACAATFSLLRLISGNDPKTRAAALLIALEREMQGLTTDDQEGLSQAISDLNECEEGTEVRHWLRTGYALLDLEATE